MQKIKLTFFNVLTINSFFFFFFSFFFKIACGIKGVELNLVEAKKWWVKAAKNGDKCAAENLKKMDKINQSKTVFCCFSKAFCGHQEHGRLKIQKLKM